MRVKIGHTSLLILLMIVFAFGFAGSCEDDTGSVTSGYGTGSGTNWRIVLTASAYKTYVGGCITLTTEVRDSSGAPATTGNVTFSASHGAFGSTTGDTTTSVAVSNGYATTVWCNDGTIPTGGRATITAAYQDAYATIYVRSQE